MSLKYIGVALVALSGYAMAACSKDPETPQHSSFDVSSMLENWADNIIIPYYDGFVEQSKQLGAASAAFVDNPDTATLDSLRKVFRAAYFDFQGISMFEIAYAMEVKYRSYINTYPADTFNTNKNIKGEGEVGVGDLASEKARDQQGLPAIDYIINGLEKTDAEIVDRFRNDKRYGQYLNLLCRQITSRSEDVLQNWQNGYRDDFVENTGTGIASSINMIGNLFISYYERYVRGGKIAIPLGLTAFEPSPERVEARYDDALSKALLKKALERFQLFFNGQNDRQSANGIGFKTYLDHLNTKTELNENLSKALNANFEKSLSTIESRLNDNFSEQIESEPEALRAVYDDLQSGVVLMKIDMTQALSIIIDYRDADGD